MFQYTNCPSCGSASPFPHFITCEDHTVSHEKFDIVSCSACNLKFTNPIPEPERLGDYYKSEEYISHSDTKKGLIARLYHMVRERTLTEKLALVSGIVSRGTILDFGCGTGMFLKTCKKAGWNMTGIEPDPGASAIAKEGSFPVFSSWKELAKEEANSFDAITMWHVLEHVSDLSDTLAFIKSRLAAKGVLVIAVPNHRSFDAEHYGRFWAAYDVPRHLYHFEPGTLERLLNKHGFVLKETHPMKFDSFYVSMLSEKYSTGSVRYLNAFLTGLRSNLKARAATNYSSVIYVFRHQ